MHMCVCICVYIHIKGKAPLLSPQPSHSLPEETVVSISASRNYTHVCCLLYCSLCFPLTFSAHTHVHTRACAHFLMVG